MLEPSDRDRIVASEPTSGQFIRDIYCWIGTYSDGTEGIIASGIEGLGLVPLVSSYRDRAQALEPLARRAQRAMMHQGHRIVGIRLVTFTTTEGTRQ